jgi:polysaccharide export outer membrane protein
MKTLFAFLTVFLLAASCDTALCQGKSAAVAQSGPAENPQWELPISGTGQLLDQRYPRYLLRPSDVLEITFPLSPEFDQTVSIQPDGYINLRVVGDFHVQGKSVPELTEMLHTSYAAFLHQPVINVELKDFEKPYFIANGEFGHPGKYDLRGDTTVAEAVAIAGGFTDKAKHSEVIIFRRTADGWSEAKRIDVKRMLARKDLTEDIHLLPGDLIYVPQNEISKIHGLLPNTGMGFGIP